MTVLDISDQLATAFAPTTGTSSPAGVYIDRLIKMYDGMGASVIFYGNIASQMTSGGSATVDFILQGDNDPAFGTAATVCETGAVAVASLVAGYEFKIKIPRLPTAYRYYRLAVTIAVANLTGGSVNAWLTNDDMQDNVSYAAGYTVA